ncbi:hypothetical protein AB835_00425 [Candidatus Endobugula sertula]|uniref:VWFA domain-containing protein n=1 Tax=Candidatus Endobugula sertula TaxID=62101 RepID=A0A1D2QTV4_9GAMM|nr:hypothetical protein AB835_00425 [Candidatus Endobugula sertula]
MLKRRSFDGFNLAFLDVMACGLGAIILILMLVKFNATTQIPSNEVERLQQELNALQENSALLQANLDKVDKNISTETASVQKLEERIWQLKIQQDVSQRELRDKKAMLSDVERSVASVAPRQVDDNVTLQGAGEENYLLGLKVEGKYIGILIDTSASMTDEKLRDIIRRKISSDAERKSAPKWRRAKRVVKWLLARVPPPSKVTVVSFNDSARQIGPGDIVLASNSVSMKQLSADLDTLIPRNGTNLQVALNAVKTLSPRMTHLYVVTDGLPTLGERSTSLRSLAHCGSLFGQSKTITGDCRLRLFNYTLKQSGISGVQVNTVLLPLEGEPHAPQAYWDWSSSTGGLMISPASSWP